MIVRPSAVARGSASVRTSAAPFPAPTVRGSTAFPAVNVRTSSVRPSAAVRTQSNFRASPSAGYASNYGTENGRNPFLTPSEGRNEQDHDDFQSIDLQPPQPAYLGNGAYGGRHGERGGSYGGGTFSDSEVDLWRAPGASRRRNPCRVRDTLTAASRRELEGIFWTLLVLNFPLPMLGAVIHSRHFSDALSWTTRGEICHLRS